MKISVFFLSRGALRQLCIFRVLQPFWIANNQFFPDTLEIISPALLGLIVVLILYPSTQVQPMKGLSVCNFPQQGVTFFFFLKFIYTKPKKPPPVLFLFTAVFFLTAVVVFAQQGCFRKLISNATLLIANLPVLALGGFAPF